MTIIRDLRGLDDLHAVEALQRDVWSVSDLEIVPAVHLIPALEVGAILLGAFDGPDLVGFVYGFPGFEHGERIIHSDMLGVRDSHRDRGLGHQLKLAQRDRALAAGVEQITWTFDPLQSRNAHLNFNKLGVTADRYIRDFYGQTTSPLHRGSTDRLWVRWDLRGRTSSVPTARIEIPTTFDESWRENTRREFEDAFGRGLIVTGFERGEIRSAYLLSYEC